MNSRVENKAGNVHTKISRTTVNHVTLNGGKDKNDGKWGSHCFFVSHDQPEHPL